MDPIPFLIQVLVRGILHATFILKAMSITTFAGQTIADKVSGVDIAFPSDLLLERFGIAVNGFWLDFLIGMGYFVLLLLILFATVKWKLIEKR